MFLFFMQMLLVGAHSFSPVMQCTDNTVFCRYGMVAVPLQILVSVGRLYVYSFHQAAIRLWDDQCV